MNLRVLDGLRGLAALYVLMHHACGLLWGGSLADDPAPALLLRNIFSFGHQAVLLFFLISGFCIHYRQALSGAHSLDPRAFGWRRARRLYPPLLLALAVTALFDWIGMAVTPSFYSGASAYWSGPVSVGASHTPLTLVGNLIFQARLVVAEFGSNSPLWSLAFEFWFYLLYPLVLAGFGRFGSTRTLVAIVSVSSIASLAGRMVSWWALPVLTAWVIWAAGAVIAEAYVAQRRSGALQWVGLASVGGFVALAWLSPIGEQHERFGDLTWGALMALALAALLLAQRNRVSAAVERACLVFRPLGEISYSLYVLHYPWLALLAALWLAGHEATPGGMELAVFGIVSSIGLGALGWFIAERRATAVLARGRIAIGQLSMMSRPPLSRLMKKRSPLWIRRAHHERGPLVLSLSKDFFISLLTRWRPGPDGLALRSP